MNNDINIICSKVDKLSDEISGLKGWIRGLLVTLPIICVIIGHVYVGDITNLQNEINHLQQQNISVIEHNTLLVRK